MRLRFFVFSSLLAAGCVPDERPQRQLASASATRGTLAAPRAEARRAALDSPTQPTPPAPLIEDRVVDHFERAQPGSDWNLTGPGWLLKEGKLCVSGARNHPAWLRRRLPTNARIEFEATSASAEGDIKVEAWGDGQSAATANSYTNATSYIVIFGGWKNTLHVLARLDEHAPNRSALHVEPGESDPRAQPVLPDRVYRFKIERSDAQTIRYFVDDLEILALKDGNPLQGVGHEYFAFNNWQVPVCFDNLTITPLKG